LQAGQLLDQTLGLGRIDLERIDDLESTLAVELGQDRADRGAVLLAVDLLREAARLGREGHAAADEDRSGQGAVTGAATLLLLRLLGRATDFGPGLLCLGASATGVAECDHDLVDQVFAEIATEHFVGNRQLVGATRNGEFHRASPYALLAGRTITSPPGAPGTAPRTAIRPRSASTRTTSRFCVLCTSAPMWPDKIGR